jgi:hypothetical protein
VQASLAATTGVETSADVAKYLLDGLSDWMSRKGFASLDELRGMLAVPAARTKRSSSARATSTRCATRTATPTAPGKPQPSVTPHAPGAV